MSVQPAQKDLRTVTERGPWLATSSGNMWSILEPAPEDVHLIDIVVGLARTCRYGGQIREDAEFYSVAEHCALMVKWMIANELITDREDALKVLFHDASEAFLGDIPTPLKALIPEYKVIEDRCQDVIDAAFGLDDTGISHGQMKVVDIRIRDDERSAMIAEPALSLQRTIHWEKHPGYESLGVEVRGLSPQEARREFVECYEMICRDLPLRNPALDQIHQLQLNSLPEIRRRQAEQMAEPCI